MNLKVANLIAIQFGITIGTVFWLAYTHFPSPEQRFPTERLESRAVMPAAPTLDESNQQAAPEDFIANREQANPDKQNYQQEIAAEPYISRPDLVDNSIAPNPQSYTQVMQEPAVVQPEYVPEPQVVEYVQPVQTVVYAQPTQIVVFSDPRPSRNRCEPQHTGGPVGTTTNHFPNGRNRVTRTPFVPPPAPPPAARPPAPPAVKVPQSIRPPVNPVVRPRQVAFPASTKTGRTASSAP